MIAYRPISSLSPTDSSRATSNYLYDRGALTLPDTTLQNALLEAYVEYIHPYMPVIELHPFLNLLHHRDPKLGRTSLLLYQTVMFAATAFVDMRYLAEAGFMTRKEARKFFFNKARVREIMWLKSNFAMSDLSAGTLRL